ncbi:MAG: tRNA (adenosine(37)-N6)-dimethylallyltransferase MiaA [Desulfovibrio sp.]|nr:tRNA (adenosine(37)-N6)-dimethylallyltransferase MiaA [Desulfovibrio sp.]
MTAECPAVLCLAGPTGAGKTALALRLAQELGCEVVNADSRQVYRDFPLVTAQPSPEERAVCPHHLYGFLRTEETVDAAAWARLALAQIQDIRARGLTPLLVGGTGFYFQTLLRGIASIPQVPASIHDAVLARMEATGPEALHRELAKADPAYAARIHPRDRQRTARALEVLEATGRPFSWWHANAEGAPLCRGPLLVAQTALGELEPRLMARIEAMLAAGALEEGKAAMAACSDGQAPGWTGIGCREIYGFLTGRMGLAEMKAAWFRATRQYAKRQITWFRGRSESVWIDLARPDETATLARRLLEALS